VIFLDGFHEVHVNTMEGFWSLLRSWLRPHRGISQEKLPLYLGFFEFIHNARKKRKIFTWKLDQNTVFIKDPGIHIEPKKLPRRPGE
jgi:transposase-like protein